jgi:hypothetical protein
VANETVVVLATETPSFRDGGDFLLCDITSGGRVWSFGILWADTERAMHFCGEVLDQHRAKARNVKAFKRAGNGSPLPHG